MAIGDYLFRLLKCNCTIDIEAGTVTTAGGSQWSWSAVASGVNVLVTTAAGNRDFPNATFATRDTFKVAGIDPMLNRPDIRLKVVTAVPGLAVLVGRYLSVVSGQGHAQGNGGILPARVNLDCVVQEVPGDDGSVL